MKDIPGYQGFTIIQPVKKGWSKDRKFYVEDDKSARFFLRISDVAEYDRVKADYEMAARAYALGAPTPQPFGFGLCDGGSRVYSLSAWIEGEDVEAMLPRIPDPEQYALGARSGEALRKIHAIHPSPDTETWPVRFGHKVRRWIKAYQKKPAVHSDTGDLLIGYLEKRREVLASRSQTFLHGDYNTENIMLGKNGAISVIDFNSYNSAWGDPWWDLNNMAWMPTMYPHFYSGQIKGYFSGEPPVAFWDVLSYYLAYDALAALTDPYGLNSIEDGTEIVEKILKWTSCFQNRQPTWYLEYCI